MKIGGAHVNGGSQKGEAVDVWVDIMSVKSEHR